VAQGAQAACRFCYVFGADPLCVRQDGSNDPGDRLFGLYHGVAPDTDQGIASQMRLE
jgi:hypothetical protein